MKSKSKLQREIYGASFIEFKPVAGKTKLFNDVDKAFEYIKL